MSLFRKPRRRMQVRCLTSDHQDDDEETPPPACAPPPSAAARPSQALLSFGDEGFWWCFFRLCRLSVLVDFVCLETTFSFSVNNYQSVALFCFYTHMYTFVVLLMCTIGLGTCAITNDSSRYTLSLSGRRYRFAKRGLYIQSYKPINYIYFRRKPKYLLYINNRVVVQKFYHRFIVF